MLERLVTDESRPGIELLELQGGPGYDDERFHLSNELINGLRFIVEDEDSEAAHFHITSAETARLIAARLVEWSNRIANPPDAEARACDALADPEIGYGWLKLRQRITGLPVWVWAPDIEMVAAGPIGEGCIVYLHHDKMHVQEHAVWVLEAAEKINTRAESDASPPNVG